MNSPEKTATPPATISTRVRMRSHRHTIPLAGMT